MAEDLAKIVFEDAAGETVGNSFNSILERIHEKMCSADEKAASATLSNSVLDSSES